MNVRNTPRRLCAGCPPLMAVSAALVLSAGIGLVGLVVLGGPVGPAAAQVPAGYYDTVDLGSQAACRLTLHAVIDGHTRYPYTSSSTDTWNILEDADEDPLDGTHILDVYRNRSIVKYTAGNDYYNREHSWPNSYGFPDDGDMPYTDCHHLFLCDIGYNSARGNLYYDDCASSCTSYPTDTYNGESGVNYRSAAGWETWQGRKGDVARAMFYLDVRYEGDAAGEPDLILTDNPALIVVTSASPAYMGLTATLLQWHQDDPVDPKEAYRNDMVYSYQHNRNPFIDHPEWVDFLFGSGIISGVEGQLPGAQAPAARIAAVAPNPFNPATVIHYTVTQAGPISLRIYDVSGRLVRTLTADSLQPGAHQATWDGRTDTGAGAASGAYFCRLQSRAGTDTEKVLLVK